MKLLYKYGLLILSVLFLFSCEKETEGLSRITYYCDLELKGNPVEMVALGQAYSEPGWEAYENDADVSGDVVVTGTVNTGATGLYRLTYSVNNTDGFPKTATRQVVVYDATPSPMESGFYTVSANSNRNGVTLYGREFTILLYQVSPGVFYVSDLFGGYYDQRAAYGSAYAMVGHITLAGNNTITLNDSHVDGWGDSLDGMSNGVYNPATKTVSWTAAYAGLYDFNVTAVKQ